eukprot:CAMPEP_0197294846 /NCGR_PEP_ID=MMETSP0890-20130614/33730_1 /TAXON_ID=44058 ORGANISM="Aureoumbra lagunensis, Strain CCMP1510" /NCGR_SAMPLE_ID=MMETSP0890 /ASSEMBLY_ACC=CAM_ASM_000533 /LENGTH=564 /DNA_ID=CAMNT_0042770493 /DNA_START=99 /DNA_END=1791 /DNA_ORIENTATION=+
MDTSKASAENSHLAKNANVNKETKEARNDEKTTRSKPMRPMMTIQQASWQQRSETLNRLEKAWEARAVAVRERREEKLNYLQPKKRSERISILEAAWEARAATVRAKLNTCREERPKEYSFERILMGNDDDSIDDIDNGRIDGLAAYCQTKMNENLDAFYVVDLGCVERLYYGIVEAMPSVRPHFAIKCFPNKKLIEKLANLKCGFDCASAKEVDLALKCGAKAQDIVFANPCKRQIDLNVLPQKKIPYTTFDSSDELEKIAKYCPQVSLLLRIRCDDPSSRLPFGAKYGALVESDEIQILISTASSLKLNLIGVSFHVGSGAGSADAYVEAIKTAAQIPIPNWKLLDLGGGFCGDFDDDGHARVSAAGDFSLPKVIESALIQYFPKSLFPKLQVISEPGRYFAESSASLCTQVIGTRSRPNEKHAWIADGCYGAFNAVLYDAWAPSAAIISSTSLLSSPTNFSSSITFKDQDDTTLTTVFGPTCDSLDCVFAKVPHAPTINTGDWLLFPNCGAYTLAGATDFNGIQATSFPIFYVRSRSMLRLSSSTIPVLYSPELPFNIEKH